MQEEHGRATARSEAALSELRAELEAAKREASRHETEAQSVVADLTDQLRAAQEDSSNLRR